MSELQQRPSLRILVCVGPRCDAEGRGRALLAEFQAALAGRADVELQTRDCLRTCTRDPIVRLEPSGEVFSNPTVEEVLRAADAPIG
jgi:hypothetical protein